MNLYIRPIFWIAVSLFMLKAQFIPFFRRLKSYFFEQEYLYAIISNIFRATENTIKKQLIK